MTTQGGRVRGRWRSRTDARGVTTTYATFRGIPFAAPPVGELRFAPPASALGWDGVRDAAEFGPTPQRESPYDPPRIPEPSIPGDDVLSVNVTTPDPSSAAGLPVLVWIHGGGFVGGSPASPWYVGQSFARDGVVTATLSYRLGFEGFGWMEDAVPNRGALDWIAGLEWIQRNIASFGGDPSRVTIAGQSAGGAAVMRLLTLPAADHLFARAMAISPADASASVDRAREAARAV
ncbi:MAG: carboxylesterase family protein, partial [Demequina sp.]